METNYLMHYGIKGQKWGVRRFQNKDGTYTPAGKKRLKDESSNSKIKVTNDKLSTKQKKTITKSISKYHKDNHTGLNSDLVDNNAFVNNLQNNPKLKKMRSEINKFSKIVEDYDKNENVQYKYKIKHWSQIEGTEAENRKRFPNDKNHPDYEWLMYEDWDQNGGSFALYLKDRGTTFDDFRAKADKLSKDYKKACDEVIDSTLGEYGKQKADRIYSWEEGTVKAAISDALTEKMDDDTGLNYRNF